MPHILESYRQYFPYLKTGRIYFNHSSVSPMSTFVTNKLKDFTALSSEGAIDDYMLVLKTADTTRRQLASLLNTDADRFAFGDNTSNGLNLLAQGLHLKHGDEVILNNLEFPANVYPFLNLQSDGVKITFAKSRGGIVTAEDIIDCISPATRVVSVSLVQFLTGYRINLKTLTDFCKPRGIIVCVDTIQGLGGVQMDLSETPLDFIASGVQKWMMGPMGFSFIYITEELQARLRPRYVGWLSVINAWNLLDYKLEPRKDAAAFQNGTMNVIGLMGFSGALELFDLTGSQNREQVILDNTEYFIAKLLELGHTPLMQDVQRENLAGIITFHPANGQEIFNHLQSKKITCSLREGMIRFSPHFYNTKDEIDLVIEELKGL